MVVVTSVCVCVSPPFPLSSPSDSGLTCSRFSLPRTSPSLYCLYLHYAITSLCESYTCHSFLQNLPFSLHTLPFKKNK